MSDDTYNTLVYIAQGGEEIVVKDGGKITLRAGATIENEGDALTAVTFDSDYFTVTDNVVTIKTEVAALLTLLSLLPTEDPGVDFAVWNNAGVIAVSNGN